MRIIKHKNIHKLFGGNTYKNHIIFRSSRIEFQIKFSANFGHKIYGLKLENIFFVTCIHVYLQSIAELMHAVKAVTIRPYRAIARHTTNGKKWWPQDFRIIPASDRSHSLIMAAAYDMLTISPLINVNITTDMHTVKTAKNCFNLKMFLNKQRNRKKFTFSYYMKPWR